jgi:hypothetical protein
MILSVRVDRPRPKVCELSLILSSYRQVAWPEQLVFDQEAGTTLMISPVHGEKSKVL